MPQYPHPVTITTPGQPTVPPTVDPETGNEVPPTPVTRPAMAWLAQRPVAVLAAAAELNATQDTSIVTATMLTPVGTVIGSKSTVVDVDGVINGKPGSIWRVEGEPATRNGRTGSFRAASLKYISDQQ